MVSTYMILGNVAMTGLGLGQVIAADKKAPEVAVTSEVQKYVQYNKEEKKGAIVQQKVTLAEQGDESTHLPIQNVTLSIQAPAINSVLPTRVSIVGANTKATNGKENVEVNQHYQADTGLLTISYENEADKKGNIYSTYQEGAVDEFRIVYNYPETAYVEKEAKQTLTSGIKAKVNYKAKDETLSIEQQQTFKTDVAKNIGDIVNYDPIWGSNLYKGFMYANENNKTKYTTNYKTTTELSVLNNEMVDQITVDLENSKYIYEEKNKENKTEQKELAANTISYLSSKIGEDEFYKVFGIDGYVDFYLGETKYATVRYADADKKGNRNFTTEYHTGDAPQGAEAGKVIYPENTKAVRLVTGNPIADAVAYVETEKQIAATNNYGVAVEKIKQVKENTKVNETPKASVITIQEPTTQMSFEVSNKNLSTLATNETTLTIKLDDTNASCNLFPAGKMVVSLPKNLTNIKIGSAKLLYENGLKLKEATIEKGELVLMIEGKQTTYDMTNVNGGVNIVVELEGMTFDARTPAHKENMKLTYAGKELMQEVNIVSKAGLLMLNKVATNNGNSVVAIDNVEKNLALAVDKKGQTASQSISLVNNYDKEVTGVAVTGSIGDKNAAIKTNTNITLAEPITVEGAKAEVYYEKASNEGGWTKDFNKNARLYKVVFQEGIKAQEVADVIVKLAVPDGLTYNVVSYLNERVDYTYGDAALVQGSNIKLATEEKAEEQTQVQQQQKALKTTQQTNQKVLVSADQTSPLSISITPHITQEVVHAGQVVTYTIAVSNSSNEELQNIEVEDIIPNNANYAYYDPDLELVGADTHIKIDTVTKSKKWTISTLKAGETKTIDIMLTMGDVSSEEEMINTANLTYNGQTASTESKLTLKPAVLTATIETKDMSIGQYDMVYRKDDEISVFLRVKNTTGNQLENINIEQEIPECLQYVKGGLTDYDGFDEYTITEQGNVENNEKFKYVIDKMNAQEEKLISIVYKVKKIENKTSEDVELIGNVYVNNEMYQTNTQKIAVRQADYQISMKSDKAESEVLKAGDKVTYTINVKNVGQEIGGITIEDEIPTQITVESIKKFVDGEQTYEVESSTQKVTIDENLDVNSVLQIQIVGTIQEIESNNGDVIQISNVAKLVDGENEQTSNPANIRIQTLKASNPSTTDDPNGTHDGSDVTPGTPSTTDDNTTGEDVSEDSAYNISGTAWEDNNRDGKRDEGEETLKDIKVTLIDASTGNTAKSDDGNVISTTTNKDGYYRFEKLASGKYLVMFEYDTNTYTVTTYQKEGVDDSVNCDAIAGEITIDGENKKAAVTNNIDIGNADINNIDIGLMKNANFDLELDKQIASISVVNPQGTKTREYNNKDFAKVDLVAKYMNDTNVIVTYKFVIKNNGDVTGYVDELEDDLPSGLEFSSELNKDWYQGSNGKLYTTNLAGVAIEPGKTSEVELVLTKATTENTTGTFTNNAALSKVSNIEGIEETTEDNNNASANVVISIKTGSAIMYIGITLGSIAIIAAGAYLVKKRIIDSKDI